MEHFAESIAALKKAEKDAARIIDAAKKERETTLSRAKGRAKAIVDKAKQESVAVRNELFSNARAEIERERAELIKKAEKDADGIRNKKLPEEVALRIAREMIGV